MKNMFSTVLIISIISLVEISIGVEPDDLIVRLNQPNSRIQGHTQKSAKGNTYFAFQEIPYAVPPVGERRFKAPEPHAGWDGVLNTTQNSKMCPQFGQSQSSLEESEDCLVLNVFTPVAPGSKERLPVFLWIYGGGFIIGDVTPYNPQYLIDGDIVIVMMNYRVGPLGFLSTEDDVVPGNMGLKDQHLALQWTFQNIELFGGNPNDIVVGGESGGAWSSSYHLLSPKSKGLLSGVIQQSGSALSTGVYMSQAREMAYNLTRNLNLPVSSDNTTSLVESLRQVSIEDLKTAALQMKSTDYRGIMTEFLWTPIVEKENEQSLITSFMHQDFMDGNFNHVPTMVGFNSEESVIFIASTDEKHAAAYDADPSLVIPDTISVKDRTLGGTAIKDVYTSTSFTNDHGAFVRFTSDLVFTRSIIRQAKLTSQYVPVHLYQFSAGKNSNPDFPGIQHVGELKYLFDDSLDPTQISDNNTETVREMLLTLWWNFIKYKNPTPEKIPILQNITWPTVDAEDIKYLNINYTLSIQENPRNYSIVEEILLDQITPPYILY